MRYARMHQAATWHCGERHQAVTWYQLIFYQDGAWPV